MNNQSRNISPARKVKNSFIFRSLFLKAIDELAIDAPSVNESVVDEISVEELVVEKFFFKSVIDEVAVSKIAETFFAKTDEIILRDHKIALTSHEKDFCQTIRIRIFSKHFILIFSIFRTMFKIKNQKNLNLNSQNYEKLSLLHDNSAAFFIILYFIHDQIRKMFRKIDLWMLIELVVLVNKYELLKSIEILLNYWLQNLKSIISLIFNNDLLFWIFVSWVFKKSKIFKKMIKITQTKNESFFEANNLSILAHVLRKICCCM